MGFAASSPVGVPQGNAHGAPGACHAARAQVSPRAFPGLPSIVRLARSHGTDRMEAAVRRALHYGQVAYQSIEQRGCLQRVSGIDASFDRTALSSSRRCRQETRPVEARDCSGVTRTACGSLPSPSPRATRLYIPHTVMRLPPSSPSCRKILSSHVRPAVRSKITRWPSSAPARSM